MRMWLERSLTWLELLAGTIPHGADHKEFNKLVILGIPLVALPVPIEIPCYYFSTEAADLPLPSVH